MSRDERIWQAMCAIAAGMYAYGYGYLDFEGDFQTRAYDKDSIPGYALMRAKALVDEFESEIKEERK